MINPIMGCFEMIQYSYNKATKTAELVEAMCISNKPQTTYNTNNLCKEFVGKKREKF